MSNQIYHNSNSKSNKGLRSFIFTDPEVLGELIDAEICNKIAQDLYRLRKQNGLTQKQLAEKLNVKQSNISRWETPGYQGYKIKILSKIARLMNGRLFIRLVPINTFYSQHKFNEFIQSPVDIVKDYTKYQTPQWNYRHTDTFVHSPVNKGITPRNVYYG